MATVRAPGSTLLTQSQFPIPRLNVIPSITRSTQCIRVTKIPVDTHANPTNTGAARQPKPGRPWTHLPQPRQRRRNRRVKKQP